MAFIELDSKKMEHNYKFLDNLFKKKGINWAIVTKLFCGDKLYLSTLNKLGVEQVCDSRVSNLKAFKSINDNVETIYIKPPSKEIISEVVKFSDISMNTQFTTIKLLSDEAIKQDVTHKIIIMIEMGELREGVVRDEFISFYKKVFTLPNIEVVGIGASFSCLYGVLPTEDKLIQLCLYSQLIKEKFKKEIPYISGGSSVVLPLILKDQVPKGINHFRIGESLFLGTDVYNDKHIEGMEKNVFKLYTQIIELTEKPMIPSGEIGSNVEGKSFDFKENEIRKSSYRAIIDLGLLDVDEKHIWPLDKSIEFVGASSDMLVVDLERNENNYKVGDFLEFNMDYMGILRILNSQYIEKKVK